MSSHHVAPLRLVEFGYGATGRRSDPTIAIDRTVRQGARTSRACDLTTGSTDTHEGNPVMSNDTLVDMLENNRGVDRAVCYVEGDNIERRLPYGEVLARALGILHHLQAMGARRGDKLIIVLNNNEQFLDAFWAAVCGGIIPVPLSVGLNDEHRHKVLRVARTLGAPLLYTDTKNLQRLESLSVHVGESVSFASLKARSFLVESLTDVSRAGKLYRPKPDDLALIQFSSGSTSEPKGVMLTHDNLMSNCEGVTAVSK